MVSFFLFLLLITAAEKSTACSKLCTIDGDAWRTCDNHMKNGATSCAKLESDHGCDCQGCQQCNTCTKLCTIDGDSWRTCDNHMKNGATSCAKLESDHGCDCQGCKECDNNAQTETTSTSAAPEKSPVVLKTTSTSAAPETSPVVLKTTNSLAKDAADKAEADRLAKEAADKAEADRLAKEAADKAEADRLAKEAADKAEAERLAKTTSTRVEKPGCSSTCTMDGDTHRTCDEHIKHGGTSCARLEVDIGCDCQGCKECDSVYNKIQTTTTSTFSKSDRIEVTSGLIDKENKWTKMTGFRCARDNGGKFWTKEWYYVSIIAHDYGSIEECMKFCEKDAYCGACDYWPQRPKPEKYGQVRSFFLCDLRDQAPCDRKNKPANCSYVMILDRAKKNWVQKKRSCTQDCDYYGKQVRSMHYDWYGTFQGGTLPLIADSEDEQYTCEKYSVTPSGSIGYCVRWTSTEKKSKDEMPLYKIEYSVCLCFNETTITPWLRVPSNQHFCAQWTCAKEDFADKNIPLSDGKDRFDVHYTNGYYNYSRRYRLHIAEREIRNCACTKVSTNNLFCMEWDCQENQNLNKEYKVSWDDEDELETQKYVCTGTDGESTVNQNGRYCTKWTGVSVGRHEFEVSSCKVVSKSGDIPKTWNCHEDGYPFWARSYRALMILMFPCTVPSVFFYICCLRNLNNKKKKSAYWCISYIFAAAMLFISMVGTMCAGLVGVIVALSAYSAVIGIMLFIHCVCYPDCID